MRFVSTAKKQVSKVMWQEDALPPHKPVTNAMRRYATAVGHVFFTSAIFPE